MKIFFISNFFLFLSLCIQAQTPEAAKKLLDEVSKTENQQEAEVNSEDNGSSNS